MAAAGPRRCVVWANIVRPPVAGASYAGYNRVLAEESKPRSNLRVVDWARMARQNPGWLRRRRCAPVRHGLPERTRRGGPLGAPLPRLSRRPADGQPALRDPAVHVVGHG